MACVPGSDRRPFTFVNHCSLPDARLRNRPMIATLYPIPVDKHATGAVTVVSSAPNSCAEIAMPLQDNSQRAKARP